MNVNDCVQAQAKDIAQLCHDVEVLNVEKDKLLDNWARVKDEARRIMATVERMKLEFADMQHQRDEWRRLSQQYRTIAMRTHTPPSPGDNQNAIDPGTTGSPP